MIYLTPYSQSNYSTEIFFINAVQPEDQASSRVLPVTRCINFLDPALRKPPYQCLSEQVNRELRRYVTNCAFEYAYLYESTPEVFAYEQRLLDYPSSLKTSLSAIMLVWDKIRPIKHWQWSLILMATVRAAIVEERISIMQILNPSKNGINKLSNPVIACKIAEGSLTVERVLFMSKNEYRRIIESHNEILSRNSDVLLGYRVAHF